MAGRTGVLLFVLLLAAALGGPAAAQPRVLPLGDSITNGGQGHVSYRYELWFDLELAGYVVDFVGTQTEINGGDPPNLGWYPDYFDGFDPDHDGYWGQRTDEVAGNIDAIASATQPDIVLIHLGTNDIGQSGAAGVTNADTNLRLIIDRLRLENPSVAILLARIIPIGDMNGYSANAGQVGPLNAVIDQIVIDEDLSPQSPVLAVDLNTGFDLNAMMQGDTLHPNLVGEAWMADGWRAVLEPLLPPPNPLPMVSITSPADGASFTNPAAIAITADASDDGSVVQVTFEANGQTLGVDVSAPYEWSWVAPPLGAHVLTAVAEDDLGATRTSDPVAVTVDAPGVPIPIPVSNGSFEIPALTDIATAPGPATFDGWVFSASTNTFLGIFNPPAGSYPTAGGNGTPTGADGANAAYLFNDGGPAEFVEATQLLSETLAPGNVYELRVAIGRFLPGQPYSFSTCGGYVIELLAGATVIASDSDTIDPPEGEFRDAAATVSSDVLDPALYGQPLSIRLTISATDADRSTHFDDVRLTRRTTTVPALPAAWLAAVAGGLAGAGALLSRGRSRRVSSGRASASRAGNGGRA